MRFDHAGHRPGGPERAAGWDPAQQEMLSGLKDFVSKATDALQARDIPRAQLLADKASRLADDLVVALKNLKPPR